MTVAERRIPAHIAVLVGASTAAYAISLAGTTSLQSGADQAVMLARAPSLAAAARISDGHDRLEADIARAATAYAGSAAHFDDITANLTALDTSLDAYAGRMQKVSGAARALPARVSLPRVSRAVVSRSAKPRVAASTGASGG